MKYISVDEKKYRKTLKKSPLSSNDRSVIENVKTERLFNS